MANASIRYGRDEHVQLFKNIIGKFSQFFYNKHNNLFLCEGNGGGSTSRTKYNAAKTGGSSVIGKWITATAGGLVSCGPYPCGGSCIKSGVSSGGMGCA